MENDSEARSCPNCGNEMVSQKVRYAIGGGIVLVAAIALLIMGAVRTSGGDADGYFTLAIGGLFVWLGYRRIRATPWYCRSCRTREFF